MAIPRPSGEIRKSYEGEESLFSTDRFKYVSIATMIFLFILPLFMSKYFISLYQNVIIFYIGALGLILLTGNTGQISIGHGAVLGVGGYTTGILAGMYNLPFFILLLIGGGSAALIGVGIGLTARRLKGWYLLVSTLAFQIIFVNLLSTFSDVTGGEFGLTVPKPYFLGYSLEGVPFTFAVVGIGILVTFLVANIQRSFLGRVFEAISHRDIVAEVLGVNLTKYKIYAFLISFFLGGLAGGLYAYQMGGLAPSNFDLFVSITFIGIILVGGLRSIRGAALGSILFVMLPEGLTVFSVRYGLPVGPLNRFVFAVIVILFILYEPWGLSKMWTDAKKYFKSWPYER